MITDVTGEIMRTVFSWRNKQAHDIKEDIRETGYENWWWTELA